jgi:putative ABC transport system permease protein
VVGATLLIETLVRLRAVNPGFRADSILTADISVPFPKYLETGKRQRFYNEMIERVRAIPGVQSAGSTSDLPYTSRGDTMGLTIEGQQAQVPGQDALFRLVSSDYLETIRARAGS